MTIIRIAAGKRPTWLRARTNTGQVAKTRIAAHRIAEKNGCSTRTQPAATPPSSSPIMIRSAIMAGRGSAARPAVAG